MVWWSKYIYLKLFHIIMRRFSGRLREVVVFVNQTIAGTGSIFRKEVWVRARFKREFIVYHFSLSMYVVPWRFLVLLTRGWKKNNNNNNNREYNFLRHPGLPVGFHTIKKYDERRWLTRTNSFRVLHPTERKISWCQKKRCQFFLTCGQ